LYSLGISILDKQLLEIGKAIRRLQKEDPSKLAEVLNSLTEKEAEQVFYTFEIWARPKQLVKDYDVWPESVIVYSMGRGGGKTRLGAEWIRKKATHHQTSIALIGPTTADTRDVMVLGPSGILSVHPARTRPKYEPSYARLQWPNGSNAKMYSGEKSDRIRGGNNEYIWIDEIGAIPDRDVFDQAMLTLRVGESRALATTTPRKGNEVLIDLYKRAVFNDDPPQKGKDVRIITGSTYENVENLSKPFMDQIVASYAGSRLGMQEIDGIMLLDSEGALWNTELLDKCRREKPEEPKLFAIGVDPQAKKKRNSDSTGIIGCCIDEDDIGYVLDDLTGSYSPSEWANRVVSLYDNYSKEGPCIIVVENNVGGDMCVETLSHARKNLPVVTTFSTQDKLSRATPVAILYEQGRIFHTRVFNDLEEELVTFDGTGKSPNRMDALVFAMNHLMATNRNITRIVEFLM
jgi:phage terminase large subunit-like protein